MLVEAGQSCGDNGFSNRFTTVTTHWLAMPVNHHGKMDLRRNRQTTVETFQTGISDNSGGDDGGGHERLQVSYVMGGINPFKRRRQAVSTLQVRSHPPRRSDLSGAFSPATAGLPPPDQRRESFRDRVVHHAVMNVIEPPLDRTFIDDFYACRRGKGAQANTGSTLTTRDCQRQGWVLHNPL